MLFFSKARFVAAVTIVIAFWNTSASEPARTTEQFKIDLAHFVERSLRTLDMVPGLSIAVVKDGEIVLTDGYGWLDSENKNASDSEARYYIASSTKSMTALTALLLDQQGKVDLDKALSDYYPGIDFDDDIHADRITLRHLLTNTSGLRNDAIVERLAYSGQHSPELLRKLLARTSPAEDTGLGQFQYTNFGFNLAALIMEDATGMPWQELVRDLVFEPLGMNKTTNYMPQVVADIARPHDASLPWPHRLYLEKTDQTLHSAGGTLTTASDIARWLLVQLNEGEVDGKRIFSKDLILQSHERLAEVGREFGEYRREHYGLGWYIGKYRESELIHHFGSFPGYRSHVSFMPEHGIGVAVFTNERIAGFELADLIANYAYSWWLHPETTSWLFFTETVDERFAGKLDELRERTQIRISQIDEGARNRAERKWILSMPLENYTGTFEEPSFGSFMISLKDEQLIIKLGNLRSVAEPYEEPETIRLELIPGNGTLMLFELDNGVVNSVVFRGQRFSRVD